MTLNTDYDQWTVLIRFEVEPDACECESDSYRSIVWLWYTYRCVSGIYIVFAAYRMIFEAK